MIDSIKYHGRAKQVKEETKTNFSSSSLKNNLLSLKVASTISGCSSKSEFFWKKNIH